MGAFLKSCVLFSCLLSAAAFPVAELSVTSTQFTQLTNASSETVQSPLSRPLSEGTQSRGHTELWGHTALKGHTELTGHPRPLLALQARSALATSLILPHLRVYFNQTAHAIEVF